VECNEQSFSFAISYGNCEFGRSGEDNDVEKNPKRMRMKEDPIFKKNEKVSKQSDL
jgi:hypothetical protein